MLNIPGLGMIGSIALVILAFSALIFIHELGHYLAARLVGVRVERFFLGFDIYGLALKKKVGGCVYGIGALPLGGYVKLAGQADDPRQQKITGAEDELTSKPLWAQALVFAAGVIMNFIFGYILLVCGYIYGIPFAPNVLGKLVEGSAAEIHGFKAGDRVLTINGQRTEAFEDILPAVARSPGHELTFEIERVNRDGSKERLVRKILGTPDESMRGKLTTIGASPPLSREVGGLVTESRKGGIKSIGDSFKLGDRITAIGDTPVPEYQGHLIADLVKQHPATSIEVTVLRGESGKSEQVTVPLRTLGEWDVGIRSEVICLDFFPGSPAIKAGLRKGDRIVGFKGPDDKDFITPWRPKDISEAVKKVSLQPVSLTVVRGEDTLQITVKPRGMPGSMLIPKGKDALIGIIFSIAGSAGFKVEQVLDKGPAESKLVAGDVIVAVDGTNVDTGKSFGLQIEKASSKPVTLRIKRGEKILEDITLKAKIDPKQRRPMIGIYMGRGNIIGFVEKSFAARKLNRRYINSGTRFLGMEISQDMKRTRLFLGIRGNSEPTTTMWLPTPPRIIADPIGNKLERNIPIQVKVARQIYQFPFGQALTKAADKWVGISLMIYDTIYKLVTREIHLQAMGGPVKLFQIIAGAADVDFWYLIYIVALISINLGVCNLLPFPVLDGGHIVFLLIEWVSGRPPSERIKEVAQYIGLVCLLSLIATVTYYDVWLG